MPKFGHCAGQARGSLEPGILQISKEVVKITNRMTDVEQDLKEKLKESLSKKRETVMREMQEAVERETQEKLMKLMDKNVKAKREYRKRENTIRVEGFRPTYTPEKLFEVFSEVGEIKQLIYPIDRKTGKRRNLAFIEYKESLSFKEALTKYHGATYDNCELIVTEAN